MATDGAPSSRPSRKLPPASRASPPPAQLSSRPSDRDLAWFDRFLLYSRMKSIKPRYLPYFLQKLVIEPYRPGPCLSSQLSSRLSSRSCNSGLTWACPPGLPSCPQCRVPAHPPPCPSKLKPPPAALPYAPSWLALLRAVSGSSVSSLPAPSPPNDASSQQAGNSLPPFPPSAPRPYPPNCL